MKKTILILLLAIPGVVLADIHDSSTSMDESKLPQPDSGVKVVSRSQLNATPIENKMSIKRLNEFKIKGYIEEDSSYPRWLLSMKYKGPMEVKQFKQNNDPFDTHLKKNISDIKLAYKYNGIPLLPNSEIIGYAAIGGWHMGGWTGIKTFFNNKELGTCSYSLDNMSLTHGAVHISEDYARYDVNKKPNALNVTGSSNSGFIYDIGWYDDKFSNELECANMLYDPVITKKLIEYARIIDKSATQDSVVLY